MAVALGGATASAHAQLHAPAGDAVSTTRLDVLAFHEARRTDLVFRRRYAAERPPRALAWVVPVPSRARAAGALARDPFDALSALWGDGEAPDAPPLAAELRVRRLSARGPDAVRRLRAWLREGGFEPPPAGRLAYYRRRGWSFVAARLRPTADETLPAAGWLPPLHVAFDAERLVVPLRLEGGVPVRLYAWRTERPGPAWARGALARGLRGPAGGAPEWRRLERPPPPLARLARDVFGRMPPGPTHLTRLATDALGTEGPAPADWTEDLALPAPAEDRALTAFAQVDLPRARAAADEDDDRAAPVPPRARRAGCACRAGVPTGATATAAGRLAPPVLLALLGRARRRRGGPGRRGPARRWAKRSATDGPGRRRSARRRATRPATDGRGRRGSGRRSGRLSRRCA